MNKQSLEEWDFVILGPIDSIYTQSLWHAAALLRSSGKLERNVLSINWPTYPIISCGYHQAVNQVVDVEYCGEQKIPIIRRAVGGGTVYLDSTQLFYHFIWHNETANIPRNVTDIFKTLLKPVVQTYRDLGVDAVYKPVNDILANNRKISGNGAGMFDSASVLVGNFILDFPRQEMARILRVPDEKFRDKVFKSLQAGISSFKDELGYIPDRDVIISTFKKNLEEMLGISLINTDLDPLIDREMKRLKTQYLTNEWLYQMDNRGKKLFEAVKIRDSLNVAQGIHKSEGGLIRVICEFQSSEIKDMIISGDFWITGAELSELEDHLKGFDIKEKDLTEKIEEFYDNPNIETSGTTAADITQAIMNAFETLKA